MTERTYDYIWLIANIGGPEASSEKYLSRLFSEHPWIMDTIKDNQAWFKWFAYDLLNKGKELRNTVIVSEQLN